MSLSHARWTYGPSAQDAAHVTPLDNPLGLRAARADQPRSGLARTTFTIGRAGSTSRYGVQVTASPDDARTIRSETFAAEDMRTGNLEGAEYELERVFTLS